MRPERVRRFPAPVHAQGFGRRPQAANDNQPAIGESLASIVIGRALIVGVALFAMALVVGGGLWLARAAWRSFA